MNNKAITKMAAILLVFVLVIVVGVAVAIGSNVQPPQSNPVNVIINDEAFTGNISVSNQLDWGAVSAGNSYTKNFTVVNPSNLQAYNLILLTSEPTGTTQAWSLNNTQLPAMSTASATLTLTLSTTPSLGTYSWKLLATNSTAPTATPTPNPSATPEPNTLSFTVDGDDGVNSITIQVNNAAPFTVTSSQLPKTYSYTTGTNLKFTADLNLDYEFNGWQYDDGSLPITTLTLTRPASSGNFTVTATTQYMTPE